MKENVFDLNGRIIRKVIFYSLIKGKCPIRANGDGTLGQSDTKKDDALSLLTSRQKAGWHRRTRMNPEIEGKAGDILTGRSPKKALLV